MRKLDSEYAIAMRELSKHYPDDGHPTEGTEEIVAMLDSVLRRDPYHIGANHYDAATLYAESLMDLHPWKL